MRGLFPRVKHVQLRVMMRMGTFWDKWMCEAHVGMMEWLGGEYGEVDIEAEMLYT